MMCVTLCHLVVLRSCRVILLTIMDSDDLYYVSMRVCIGWHDRDRLMNNNDTTIYKAP